MILKKMGGLFVYLYSCIFALFVKNGGSGQEKTPAEAGAYEGGKWGRTPVFHWGNLQAPSAHLAQHHAGVSGR